ncbi:hypothetical protein PTKIN_Ptkin14bG0169800 [Pterospermum kingtungense]
MNMSLGISLNQTGVLPLGCWTFQQQAFQSYRSQLGILEWIQGKILKFSFPRIFALACLKNGVIKDYGCFVEGIWRWEIDLRRSLFSWEWQQWNNLLSCLNKFQVCESLWDVLIWKSSPSGNFTPKACCRDYGRNATISVHPWAKIWSGFLPPKVKVFYWQLLHGKVAVKVNLAARNSLSTSDLNCTFCGNNFEGQIPDVFGNLNKLIMLDFSFNDFRGLLPSSAFNLTGLTFMDLSYNHIGGSLPFNISGLSNLRYLQLSTNLLNGRIYTWPVTNSLVLSPLFKSLI